MGKIILEEQTAPDTPATDKVVIYPKAGGGVYKKNDAGDEEALTNIPIATDTIWIAAGDLVVGTGTDTAHVLTAGATTKILVGGGAADPVWTEATGTGAPVRATNPTLAGVTLSGIMAVGENSVQLDATLSATAKYSGITCDIVIGYDSATFGDLVYLSNSDDRWEKTDANTEGMSGDVMLGLVISGGSSDGDAGVVLLQGFMKLTSFDFASGGDALYVGETAGTMVATRPSTASTIVRVVGYAGVDADTVYFNPSGAWIETAA